MRLKFLLVSFALAAVPALAQQPAAGATDAVPKHSCGKAPEFPGALASDGQKRQFQRDYVTFTDCLKKFVTEQNKLAEPHIKAASEGANEYNAAVKAFNDMVTKENEKSK